ncbi:hypothetical protein N7462_005112 [Penicillium macrosclerotiorum]|uniref:uncharacterized protein n=1 Tax=Penicillium macrosclerotiorum TaxID=303699 RepID=UPI0025498684|nr:uncharacterized protein N7462_005112 [Penicillium macrosclerotiorum]KAJ5690720.1 hypothetical protein N7462_005112 [Penicillium macrosclerotiorum]
MPYPRPVSPLSLETREPPANSNDGLDLLGSDDELDDTARAAKRQRIEKLAESYLQGRPLFILSASLHGPFDKDWKNPWKKNRKVQKTDAPGKKRTNVTSRNSGPVIQETDPQRPKYREDLPNTSRSRSGATPSSPTTRALEVTSSVTPRSAHKRPLHIATRGEGNPISARSLKRPKEPSSLKSTGPSFARAGPADWLKKDRKRMDFQRFEPPSSPTLKVANRQAEHKARCNVSPAIEVRLPISPTPLRTLKPAPNPIRQDADSATDKSPLTTRSAVQQSEQEGENPGEPQVGDQPSSEKFSPKPDMYAPPSFRVVSSTSQLPRFEYRHRHLENSSLRAESNSPSRAMPANAVSPNEATAQKNHNAAAAVSAPSMQDKDGDTVVPDVLEDPRAQPSEKKGTVNDGPSRPSEDLRFAGVTGELNAADTEPQPSTEQNTYESLPSAQKVMKPLGISDRIQSLHSTTMPKAIADNTAEGNSDTQLSTQAALLHAQRSFQEDLDSPEPDIGRMDLEDSVLGPGEESLLARETPCNNLIRHEPVASQGLNLFDKDRIQGMSTQCLVDAVTPFTFSTGKKPKAFRDLSSELQEHKKGKAVIEKGLSSPSPCIPSPCSDHGYHTAEPTVSHQALNAPFRAPDPTCTHQSTNQATPLLFSLGESTSTTAQDGQGPLPGFNLSQTIDDVGSWLREGFDFMKDI